MKILTINTHSHQEENYQEKCQTFATAIAKEKADIILMQEVNQTASAQSQRKNPIGKIPVKEDNYALNIQNLLKEKGLLYNFVWLGIKKGFQKYDEGLAIMSTVPISNSKEILLSPRDEYNNWKTRKALLCHTHNMWICVTHMGWWNDMEDPFENQFCKLDEALKDYDDIILGGDFNAPDNEKGYDLVLSRGWHDTYKEAKEKSGYATVPGNIAGWEENQQSIRIDYIFSKQKKNIQKSYTIFDDVRYNIISDHFGVISEF